MPAFGQSVDTAWVRRYNGPGNWIDGASAIAVDGSGNVFVTGTSDGVGTLFDYATIKYYPDGDTAWVSRYNGLANKDDWADDIAVDVSGNVYVTGESYGDWLNYDYTSIKYYSNGDTAWVRRYNGPGDSDDYARVIAIDGSGNVYVTGGSRGSGTSDDYATIKYYPNGGTAWVRRYNGPGNGDDRASAMAVDGSGNVYVTGFSAQNSKYPYIYDYATIKYDQAGNELWVRRYNGPGDSLDYAYAIAVDVSRNVYITGFSWGSGTGYDYATIKYYPDGDTAWVRRYNGPMNSNDRAYAIAVDGSGNVYVTGYPTIKYDADGNELWVGSWGGGIDIALDTSKNVYVTGTSIGTGSGPDYVTIKYYPDGDTAWVRRYNGPGTPPLDYAAAIAVDKSGNVYVTGTSEGSETDYDYATIKYVQEEECGDLLFRPNPDGWHFSNTQGNMWPYVWLPWDPLDELCFCIPYTRCFPTWELFTVAFGSNQTEFPDGTRRPRAEALWKSLKRCWPGSCFGFAISSFLFFDNYLDISNEFPGYAELYSVPINDDSRLMQNKYFIHQFGKTQRQHINANYNSTTTNQTLNDCRVMFNASTRDDRILVLFNNHGTGGHAVNPYRCEVDPAVPETTHIYVYDNNFPGDDSKRVSVSTVDSSWSYDGLPGWGGKKHLFLMDPISNYTSNPILPQSIPPPDRWISKKNPAISEYVEFYISPTDTALFESPTGNIGHIGDSLFTTLSDGHPIIPITGEDTPPIGYHVPNDAWTSQFSGITDSTFRFSLFAESTVLAYWRTGVDSSQAENLRYAGNDSTLLILNPDTESRFYNLEVICVAADSEIYYSVKDVSIDHSDSARYSIKPASQLQLDNYGGTKTYGLRVEIAGINGDTVFFHEGITLVTNSSHLFIPDWRPHGDSLMILVDSGMVGSFSDTVFVENQDEPSHVEDETGSREKPSEFALFQNYPNPFNQTTKIEFTLAKSGFVTLHIYDILARRVRTLVSEHLSSGYKSVFWDGKNDAGEDVASGIYFCQLRVGGFSEIKKLVLLK